MSAPLPPEPEALRGALRAAAGEAPEAAHDLVADVLCRHLGSFLGQGADRADPALLRRVVEGCRYEAFLWVMGDRRWGQLAEALLGRVQRRRHPLAGRTG